MSANIFKSRKESTSKRETIRRTGATAPDITLQMYQGTVEIRSVSGNEKKAGLFPSGTLLGRTAILGTGGSLWEIAAEQLGSSMH